MGIARDTMGSRIQYGFAIDDKSVLVMPVVQRNLQQPCAVGLSFHRVGFGIPVIEVANEADARCARGHADEVNGLGHFLG